ncbi:U4/U6 x U5 tri-snRNP complex subunit Prp1 [Malassezia caprae]|uniref:U4/U6 x U5 tri-snRNP complex subunit Prp1 n=1 Tax=Malassezia caprae TaxID=1381934 RepID=A0AAF0IUP2_9BASI|nr:U4/U6 x U5 tri-snRNP complex subunit Prp1 [Malassezia caprae]
MASSTPNKLAFLSMQAPAGYVAGLGRGASGFTTRSDIGPAREGPSAEVIAAARARRGEDDEDDDNDRFQDPEEETALFATSVYEKDDEEADKIWESVDRHMDERRRKQREAREAAEREALRQSQPKIQAQFADLKRNLSTVSEEEWASLPEPGNLTGKRRKAASLREGRDNRTYAMPDSVLLSARNQNEMQTTAADPDGTVSSLTEIGEARNKVFSHQLDQASSQSAMAASGLSTSIDPKGYLTELSGVSVKSSAEIGDIKKARSLLDSVIRTNPKHAPGWIAAARLEEVAGKMAVARKVIAQGCEQCPRSEDVWLESARLNTVDHAKVILARAIQYLSQSVSIWLKAMELERDAESKKRVLRKALEHIPHSVKLWKELVNLEESPEDARVLLAGAVEAVPLSVELWLALARLSVPAEAKSVLNRARRTIPTSHEIWIAAARLLEQDEEDSASRVDRTMAAAVASLSKAGAVLSRDQWLREAEQVDKEGSPQTCAAIVKATIHLDLDAEDRRRVWAEDAQASVEHGRISTARAILQCALDEFPDALEIWRQAATLERVHGTSATLQSLLERGVQHCPHAESLWLLYADDLQRIHDVDGARAVLGRAFDANVGSETISLAAAKLEADVGELARAGALLARARTDVPTERVWVTSIELYWQQKSWDEALRLCQHALQRFPKSAALHMMHGRLYEAQAQVPQAREAYAAGRQACAPHTPLWVLASRLEESVQASIRARALLEKGRQTLSTSDVLWAESAAVELRTGNMAQAKTLLSRGLQACPTSGRLMSASIWLEPRPSRKTRAAEALRRSGDSPHVICTVARLFWDDGKYVQARDWFAKTVQAARTWGDGWAWWYAFEETQADGEAQRTQLREKIDKAEPREGDVWEALRAVPEHANEPASALLPLAAREVVARTTAT